MMEKNASFSLPCALELNKKTSKTKNATVACKQQDNLPLSSQRVPWPVIWFQSSGVITMVGCRFNWSKNIKMLTENERFRLLSSKGYKSAIQICSMNRKRKIRWLDECGMRCRVMLCEWFMSGTEVMFNSFSATWEKHECRRIDELTCLVPFLKQLSGGRKALHAPAKDPTLLLTDSDPWPATQGSSRLGLTDSESGWTDSESGPGRRTRNLIRDRNGIRGGQNTPRQFSPYGPKTKAANLTQVRQTIENQ